MQKHYTFQTQKSEKEVYDILTKYFKKNGFYQVTISEGLKFVNYAKHKPELSPDRFKKTVSVKYKTIQNKSSVHLNLNLSLGIPLIFTNVDKEYFKAYFKNIEETVKTGKIELFDVSKFEDAIAPYLKTFKSVNGIVLIIGLLVWFLFRDEMGYFGDYLIIILLAPIIAVAWVNFKMNKDSKLI